MKILFALLTLIVGLAMLFGGFRLARYVIPLWGFVAGLSVGGSVIAGMQSTPFLGTILGITIGIALGLLFGVFAYLFYNVAVVVLIGAIGYWVGSNFVMLFGFNPGLLSVLVGTALGIALGLIGLMLDAPKYVLIAGTAMAGSMAAIGGILLLFNQIPLDNFSYAAVSYTLNNSFAWTMAALALVISGIAFQIRTTAHYGFGAWALGGNEDGQELSPPTRPAVL